MAVGYTYILECSDGSYYTGSTKYLYKRLEKHQNGEGANYTKKHLPVKLVYFETFNRIDQAFYREKQIQGWSRKKKEALIQNMPEKLHDLARCLNESSHVDFGSADFDSADFDSADFDSADFDSADFDSAQSPGKSSSDETNTTDIPEETNKTDIREETNTTDIERSRNGSGKSSKKQN